jgi:hypothetical protein
LNLAQALNDLSREARNALKRETFGDPTMLVLLGELDLPVLAPQITLVLHGDLDAR